MIDAMQHPARLLLPRIKALADEKRLRIVAALAEGERCVCELQAELEAGQSLLSFHLRTLRDAGLVVDRREGRWVYYALDRDAVAEVETFLSDVRATAGAARVPSTRCD